LLLNFGFAHKLGTIPINGIRVPEQTVCANQHALILTLDTPICNPEKRRKKVLAIDTATPF
jgi:hypothetical protein